MTQTGDLSSARNMTVMEHIREIQARLFFVAIVFIIGASLAYIFREQVIQTLLSPLGGQTLIYLNPAGGFSFIFLVSLYCGLLLAAPLFVHQLYSFIRPTLPAKIQRYSIRILLSSMLLLAAGVAFGYFVAVPGALDFLNTFADEYVVASLTADSYLNFIIAYTVGLGLVFQLPLLLMLVHWIKPMTPGGLLKSERWIIVLAFIAAAIITPTPDPVNQAIIAAPIVVVYQLGVAGILVSIFRTRKETSRVAKTTLQPVKTEAAVKPAVAVTPLAVATALWTAKPLQPVKSVDGFAPVARPQARKIILPERPMPTRPNVAQWSKRPEQTPRYLDGVSRIIST